jgi:hypothetical protein
MTMSQMTPIPHIIPPIWPINALGSSRLIRLRCRLWCREPRTQGSGELVGSDILRKKCRQLPGLEPRAAQRAWRGWRAPDLPRREHQGTLIALLLAHSDAVWKNIRAN